MTGLKRSGAILALALCLTAFIPIQRAAAEEWPLSAGDFWDVTGVKLKDGGDLSYAKFLAGEWRTNQEFAKSQGWIKGYMVLSNINARSGEPDLYLVVIRDKLVSGPEDEKRDADFRAWKKKSIAQMQQEAGDRSQYREIVSSELLQEMKFR